MSLSDCGTWNKAESVLRGRLRFGIPGSCRVDSGGGGGGGVGGLMVAERISGLVRARLVLFERLLNSCVHFALDI